MTKREREREIEKERERRRERDMYNMVALFLFSKGMMGALAPFGYLVIYNCLTVLTVLINCSSKPNVLAYLRLNITFLLWLSK